MALAGKTKKKTAKEYARAPDDLCPPQSLGAKERASADEHLKKGARGPEPWSPGTVAEN